MIIEIWQSFRRTPLWVQIWVGLILIPMNLLPLAFLDQPNAGLIAALSIGGMLPNMLIMALDRGISKAMSISHLLFWIPLVVIVSKELAMGELTPVYTAFLGILLMVDLVSLGLDIPESIKWLRGERAIA
ncbi:hypothetical protein [Thalassobius sp. Cn5-15]|uniref:hypothetical protein n=1 Tax=Thalassobius sp. Cn5-15 TaxID=2917763 RepID=UPI001EF3352C|nr:hypothetical protein [Thalassobius sp. Cn5-15]MCG7491979.1 hypothetical protein [Thalassobius sp. Cn5-15]